MIPITAASAVTTPPPIVNTTTPGTNETHTPPTIVAPSFSSSQVDNNARGNSTYVKAAEAPPPPLTQSVSTGASASVGVPQSPSDKFTLGAQTNFLAQLIGQDITPSVQGVLVQYEKLVNIGNVKYKPSDAGIPEEQPSSVFGKLLQSEHQQPPPAPVQQQQSAAAIAASSGNQSQQNPVAAPRLTAEVSPSRPSRPSFAEEIAVEDAGIALQNAPAPKAPPRGISAYLSTASRVSSQSAEDTSAEAPVSQVA